MLPECPGKVFVYWDLHHLCWSVKSVATGRVLNIEVVEGKRVKVDCQVLWLRDCTFHVQRGGREKALRQNKRTVHAGVCGWLTQGTPERAGAMGRRVRYDWRAADYFQDAATGERIDRAPLAFFCEGRVWIDP